MMNFEAYRQHMLKQKKLKEQAQKQDPLAERLNYLSQLKQEEELQQREEKRKKALEASRQTKRIKVQKEEV